MLHLIRFIYDIQHAIHVHRFLPLFEALLRISPSPFAHLQEVFHFPQRVEHARSFLPQRFNLQVSPWFHHNEMIALEDGGFQRSAPLPQPLQLLLS